jgi:hypothetical protein
MTPRASPQPNRAWIEWVAAEMRKVRLAQAGEAGTAATTKIGAVHEHAVRDSGCARNKSA